MDIVVTTPKSEMPTAEQEARDCIAAAEKGLDPCYFRTFRRKPKGLEGGSRIFYVEDGYIRGFATVREVVHADMECDTTGRDWGAGFHAIMPATSWQWIDPIPMRGFQGFRYFTPPDSLRVIAGWRDPRPR